LWTWGSIYDHHQQQQQMMHPIYVSLSFPKKWSPRKWKVLQFNGPCD
jgi:hypothetical protein